MTRDEANAWVASLKPGDVVIQKRWIHDLYILHVKKITPTWIVRTDEGESFKVSEWSELVRGYGKSDGEIVPATDELVASAQEQQKARDMARMEHKTVMNAFYTMCSFRMDQISFDFAKEFLELCQRHGIDI